MSPPLPLPLDHLMIKDHQQRRHSLFLGLALCSSNSPPPQLDLSLTSSSQPSTANNHNQQLFSLEPPSLTLSLIFPNHHEKKLQQSDPEDQSSRDDEMSSFSNSITVKREREQEPEEVEKLEVVANNMEHEEDVSNFISSRSRKKLRLNKEQAALLEDSFKLQSTLNHRQKEALARQLNLRPRQVEVWFQNRRARTKLKQTEVDCELLKKCCERLTEENSRLHKELQELKALKQVAQPLYMQMQVPSSATLTMCPSCKSLANVRNKGPTTNSHPLLMSTKQRMIFSPFTKPSAAC